MDTYHFSATAQSRYSIIRCRAILRQRYADKFYGRITLEDEQPCNIAAVFDIHQERLRVDVYALNSLWHRRVTLKRNSGRNSGPDARDFAGVFAVGDRRYEVGVIILQHRQPLELLLWLRPMHLYAACAGVILEVVK